MSDPAAARYDEVYAFDALRTAFHLARRAKRGSGGEPAFYRSLEDQLLELSDALRTRRYVPDPYRYFTVRNRKERVVSEASFRDRIVHHSLVAAMEPAFEARFVPWSYACRRGKGTHRAVARCQRLTRRHGYFLVLDVSRYFETLPHDVVMAAIEEVISDEGILWLCRRILEGARRGPGSGERWRGIPIGNLTSQFWANIVLDAVDQHVVRERGAELPALHGRRGDLRW